MFKKFNFYVCSFRGVLSCFFALGFIFLCNIFVYAYSVPDYVRIGLEYKYKDVTSVPILNNSITIGFEYNNTFFPEATVNSSSGFSMSASSLHYLRVEEFLNSYSSAKALADSITTEAFPAVPACVDTSSWYVYIGGFANIADANTAKSKIAITTTLLQPSNSRIELKSKDVIAVFDSQYASPQVSAADGAVVSLEDRKFRGRIEFLRYSNGRMCAINVLGLSEYLYGASSSEMPASWHFEALKAQAVASRSYVMSRSGIHKDRNYDLCDGVHCQSYKGYGNEAPTTNRAVDETAGVLIYYNGNPINAVFFSSSGGYTEDSENVWVNGEPYLKSVNDSSEYESKIWNRNFTLADINTILSKNNVNIGNATDVRIVSFTNSGRVSELQIIGTNGVKSLQKEEIRTFFGVLGGNLESRMFQIVKGGGVTDNYISIIGSLASAQKTLGALFITDTFGNIVQLENSSIHVKGASTDRVYQQKSQVSSASGDGNFFFDGKGYGHGVGMSQYGAKALAEAGYSYVDILKHYYTGVDIL